MTTLGIRHTMALVILFVLLAVTLIALDNRHTLDPLKSGLRTVTSPVVNAIDDLLDRDGSLSTVEIELQQTQEALDAALAENAQLKIIADDYEQLRKILDVEEANPGREHLAAKVINYDPAGLQKFIIIDRGARDGIEIGMAVVSPYYFVGLVTEVEEDTSRVTLAIDATSSVGARLLESNGIGVVYGRWQAGGRMELQHVDRSIEPLDGETVVTSDATGARTARVPAGLIIGKVSGEPALDNQSDSQTIQVLPAADFDNLTIVAVIISVEGS
ncbi:MAG: rod shape-determining protein MreC [Thermomicrobiales bacterium]|nr:rod shape-determining protein MreC [Thermomicrobiales bacterium]